MRIKKPANSGALYHNYKGYFSNVMMAVCDGNYRLMYVDFGSYGHASDAGTFVCYFDVVEKRFFIRHF